MTEVELESFLDARPDVLISFANRNGRTATVIEESRGYFRVNIDPDLTAGQITAVGLELNKIGRGTIT